MFITLVSIVTLSALNSGFFLPFVKIVISLAILIKSFVLQYIRGDEND